MKSHKFIDKNMSQNRNFLFSTIKFFKNVNIYNIDIFNYIKIYLLKSL